MKELEGKKVYLRPTGNNARRYAAPHEEATILKVARVFVTFTIGDSSYEQKYRYEGMSLYSGHNAGYIVYQDKVALDEYYEAREISLLISSKYRYASDFENVDISKLRQILELLNA